MLDDYMGNEAQEMMRQRALQAQMAQQARPRPTSAAAAANPDAEAGPSIPPPGPTLPPQAAPAAAAATAAPGPDTSKWNTDGYAIPKAVKAGAGNAPPGWNQEKWANQDYQTPKYVVGRILSNYEDTPAGLKAAMPDIQAAYPGARLVNDKDKIEIPGVGIVDVGTAFSVGGGKGWRWGANDGAADAGVPAGAGGGLGADFNPFSDLGNMTSESTYSKLMRRMSQSTPELLDQQALMSLLTQ